MRQIDDAARMLDQLQKGYGQSLGRVDRLLRSAVAQDPACVAEAKALQARYAALPPEYFEPAALAPLTQPDARHNDPQVPVQPVAPAPVEFVAAVE